MCKSSCIARASGALGRVFVRASMSECGVRTHMDLAVGCGCHAGECVSIRINCKNQKFNNSYYFPMRWESTVVVRARTREVQVGAGFLGFSLARVL